MVDERKTLQDLATVKATEHEDGSHTLSARGKTARCRTAGDVQAFLQALPDAQAEADRVNVVGLKTYSQSDVVFTFRGGLCSACGGCDIEEKGYALRACQTCGHVQEPAPGT